MELTKVKTFWRSCGLLVRVLVLLIFLINSFIDNSLTFNTFHYRRRYVCHHSRFQKVDALKNKKGCSKNADCTANIYIKIKLNTPSVRKIDPYVKNGLQGLIKVSNKHSHAMQNAEAYRFLPSTLQSTFYNYFEDGMTASEALHHHVNSLELQDTPEEDFANARINPTPRTIYNWYDKFRMENLGPRSGDGVVKKLTEKKEFFQEKGITVEWTENPLCILVMTPIMKRSHQLPLSKEIVFMDSTSSCDAEMHTVTFLLTPCAAGAAPLAILITQGQSRECYRNALCLIKNHLPDAFCRNGYPKVFLTDNSVAEMEALNDVWPASRSFLCIFHVLQAVWRWLWDSKNKISADDRIRLINRFKEIIYSDFVTMDECLMNALQEKYPQWNTYLTNTYYPMKEKWILAYREPATRGHHTNNYSEVSVRIFKENVLSRTKPYNVVSLINFASFALDKYYTNKFRHYAYSRTSSHRLFLQSMLNKASYLTEDNITVLKENSLFLVPSESIDTEMYTVDTDIGSCSCPAGMFGKFCKHQYGVYKFFNIKCENFPPITKKDKYEIAVLALGDKAPEVSFFGDFLCDKQDEACNNIISEGEIIGRDSTDTLDTNTTDLQFQDSDMRDKIYEEFEKLKSSLEEKILKFSAGTSTLNALQNFNKRIESIKSNGMLESLLYTVGSSIAIKRKAGKIKVQPTSIQRRRKGTSRGGGKIASGRLAVKKHSLIDRVNKNKR